MVIMIKRILVPLDASDSTTAAVQTACELSISHHAEIVGATLTESPYTPDIDELRTSIFESFDSLCESNRAKHAKLPLNGAVIDRLNEEARTFDLIVTGINTRLVLDDESNQHKTLPRLLDSTPTPILAVNQDGAVKFNRVLIAYDGSRPSAHALREFASIAGPLDQPEVVVLCSNSSPAIAESVARKADYYLRCHNFNNVTPVATTDSIYEHIASEYLGKVDLIVVGIHSKRPLRDLFIGSLPKALIGLDQVPILLTH